MAAPFCGHNGLRISGNHKPESPGVVVLAQWLGSKYALKQIRRSRRRESRITTPSFEDFFFQFRDYRDSAPFYDLRPPFSRVISKV